MVKQYPVSLLRVDAVLARTGIKSKSSLYSLISKGEFPKPIRLGVNPNSRSVAWPDFLCDNWIAERIAASKEA